MNGIRALAVIAVLYAHFADTDSYAGQLGVRVFFVLSAFLITGNLLSARDATNFQFREALTSFYWHRVLRIAPTYYLMIAGVALLGADVSWDLIFHAFFLSNLWFIIQGDWQPWQFSALWTLSVEWQFYLVWPLLVLTSTPRSTIGWAIGLVLSAVAFWIICIALQFDSEMLDLWFPASLDALGVGALTRLFYDVMRRPAKVYIIAAIGAAAIAMTIKITSPETDSLRVKIFLDFLVEFLPLLPIALLIAITAARSNSVLNWLLGLPPLVALGQISYGVYLYHLPIFWLAMKLITLAYGAAPEPSLARMVLMSVPTLVVAYISWRLIEKPLQRFKTSLPGQRRRLSPGL